ncbi:MAG: hypothetical protein ACJ764_14735 [Solirubrobacteraceae bacterium]
MTGIDRRRTARDDPARAALARDAAMGRIGRARRWLLLAAVAMTAGLTALASSLLPGKSLGSTGARARSVPTHTASGAGRHRVAASAAAVPPLPAPAGAGQLGLQGPAQAPAGSAPSAPSQPAAPPAEPQSAAPPAPSGGEGTVVSGGS